MNIDWILTFLKIFFYDDENTSARLHKFWLMTAPGWTELRGDQTPPLYTGAGVPRSLHPPPPTPHGHRGGGGE